MQATSHGIFVIEEKPVYFFIYFRNTVSKIKKVLSFNDHLILQITFIQWIQRGLRLLN